MQNQTEKTGLPLIMQILQDEYGVGILYCNATTLLWAADKIEETESARDALKQANKFRNERGLTVAYPPHGHRLF